MGPSETSWASCNHGSGPLSRAGTPYNLLAPPKHPKTHLEPIKPSGPPSREPPEKQRDPPKPSGKLLLAPETPQQHHRPPGALPEPTLRPPEPTWRRPPACRDPVRPREFLGMPWRPRETPRELPRASWDLLGPLPRESVWASCALPAGWSAATQHN